MGWLSGWAKRVKLSIDADDIDANLTNFPTLLHISASCGINSEDISFVFDELTSDNNRKKIAVTTSDGTTECKVEIEKWDDANEQSWLWVKVPAVDATSDTDLYLYYDHTHADNDTNVGDIGSTPAIAVWDANFKAVYHLVETASTSKDSKGVTDLTWVGTTDDTIGEVANGHIYDGDSDYEEKTACPFGLTTAFTIEFWFKPTDMSSSNKYIMMIGKAGTGTTNQLSVIFEFVNDTIELYTIGQTGDSLRANSQIAGLTAAWHHVWYSYDGSTLLGYLDGVKIVNTAKTTTLPTLDATTIIGAGKNIGAGSYANFIKGSVDENRWSNIARGASWMKATYETSRDHLLDWGVQESSYTDTKTYALDVIEKQLNALKTYSLGVIFQSLGVSVAYPLDVVIKKLATEKAYSIDMATKQLGVTKAYLIDAILEILLHTETVPYDVDVIIIKLGISAYDIDVLLKVLNTTEAYLLDIALRSSNVSTYNLDMISKLLAIVKTYKTDVVLEKLAETKIYDIDFIAKLLNTIKTYSVDVTLKTSTIKSWFLDILFEKLGTEKQYLVDTFFKMLDVGKLYSLDVEFIKRATRTWILDVVFKTFGQTKLYDVDTVIKKIIESGYKIDTRFSNEQSKQFLIDVILEIIARGQLGMVRRPKYKKQHFYLRDTILSMRDIVIPVRMSLSSKYITSFFLIILPFSKQNSQSIFDIKIDSSFSESFLTVLAVKRHISVSKNGIIIPLKLRLGKEIVLLSMKMKIKSKRSVVEKLKRHKKRLDNIE